jgi:hypothetical protein
MYGDKLMSKSGLQELLDTFPTRGTGGGGTVQQVPYAGQEKNDSY